MSDITESTRFRSPPYPSISLRRAIERAEQLFRQERDHVVPISSAARAWGMSPTSSGPIQVIGALRQFNLLDDEGTGASRKIRLTSDALRIVLDKQPGSQTRLEALQRCFLSPKIFAELWGLWRNNLPSNQTIINHLVLERRLKNLAPYSEQAALELLGNYRDSMAFAEPAEGDNAFALDEPGEGDAIMPVDFVVESRPEHTPSSTRGSHGPGGVKPPTPSVDERERVVFAEQGVPRQYVKIIASGELDEDMLDAISDYVSRAKRRLQRSVVTDEAA